MAIAAGFHEISTCQPTHLARAILVHDALRDGRLARLLPPQHDRLSAKVHVVRWSARLEQKT